MRREGRDISKVKDLTPEAIKLGFGFATAVKNKDSTALEILEQIEKMPRYGVTKTMQSLHNFVAFLSWVF